MKLKIFIGVFIGAILLGGCNTSTSILALVPCSECSGTGRVRVREDCASCTGGMVFQDCQQGCTLITRDGQVVFQHGFFCPECKGKGQRINAAGMIQHSIAAGLATGGNRIVPPPPTIFVACKRCSGKGGFMCTSCFGTGRIPSTCSKCKGTGSIMITGSSNCGVCNGGGWMRKMVDAQKCG